MQWLKQSTSITIRIGPFVDSTDGVTAEAALAIAQADIRLSKNGAAFAQTNDAGGATHDENGWYYLTLDATDTATLGRLDVAISESGALPVWREYMILEGDAYDAMCAAAGTGHIEADTVQVSGDAAAADNLEADYDGTGYNKSASEIATVTALTGHTAQTGDNYARLGAPAGASVSADIAAVEAQTDDIGVAGAGLTAVPWNAAWDAEVESEVDDALGAGGADLTAIPWNAAWDAEVESEVDDALGAAGADLTALPWNAAWDAEVQSECADALTAYNPPTSAELVSEINDVQTDIAALNDPTAAAVADAVWDEAKAGHVAAGSFGEEEQAHALSSEIAALNDPTAAAIADAVWDEAIAGHLGAGSTGAALNGASAPTAADVADAVWDEARAGHVAGGTFGETLATVEANIDNLDAAISGLNDPSAADVADAVWDEAKAGHVAGGSFGEEVQAHGLSSEIAALNDPTVAQIADGVWDEAIAGHLGAGSTGAALNGASAPTAADVADAVWDEAKAGHVGGGSFGEEVQAHALSTEIAALNDPSAADIADAVWDELLAGHLGAGSTGNALNAAGAAGDPWTTMLPGAYGAGTAGYIVGTNVDQILSDMEDAIRGADSDTLETLSDQLDDLGDASIEMVGPVVDGGNAITYRGDTYLDEDDRALEWSSSSWPDLTGGSVVMIIKKVGSFAGTIVTPTGTVLVRLELTATQTGTIPAGRHGFQVVATQADGDVATLVDAVWISRARAEG